MHNKRITPRPPLVSVITPNYNGLRFIRRCIESVRQQNADLEHIIIDDCSTDGSWELLLELEKEYSWLKPFRLKNNGGPAFARNKAINLAQGRFLAFLDVDDFWLPHKLETQVQFMLKNDCALSYSDYRFVSEDGVKIGRLLSGFNRIGWHLHHMTRYLGCLTITIDRSKLPDFTIPNLNPEYRVEDFNAWSYCIRKTGPVLRCPHDLARYSVVFDSRSSNKEKAAKSVWKFYRQVEKINPALSVFYFSIYAAGVAWKRFRYRPCFDRGVVDRNYSWSILR